MDSEIEAVIKASVDAEAARKDLVVAEEVRDRAVRAAYEARRRYDTAMETLNSAIRAKAASDLEQTKHVKDNTDAFRLRFHDSLLLGATAGAVVGAAVNEVAGDKTGAESKPIPLRTPTQTAVLMKTPQTWTDREREEFRERMRASLAKVRAGSPQLAEARSNGTMSMFDWHPVPPEDRPSRPSIVPKQPISTQVRELFRNMPNSSLTTSDVLVQLSLDFAREGVVRQTLRRLYEDGYLIREERGHYRLNTATKPANDLDKP